MRTRSAEFSVGVFTVLTIIALFFLALRVSGLLDEVNKTGYTVTAHFQNIGGLTPRAKVTMSGVVIGRVIDISLDQKRLDAVVTMQINDNMKQISTDSTASILTEGLIGGKYIGISVGADDTVLKNGSEIEQTQSALVLEDLISKFLFSKATEPTPAAAAAPAASAASAAANSAAF